LLKEALKDSQEKLKKTKDEIDGLNKKAMNNPATATSPAGSPNPAQAARLRVLNGQLPGLNRDVRNDQVAADNMETHIEDLKLTH
jgi:hypothetical protein